MKSTDGIEFIQREPRIHKREAAPGPIANTRRVERSLKLIQFLQEWQTIKSCAELLEVHPKSIHRFFNMLIGFGFDIQYQYGKTNLYKIINTKRWLGIK